VYNKIQFHCPNTNTGTFLSWYVYLFSIVTVVRLRVLCCGSCRCTCFVLWKW